MASKTWAAMSEAQRDNSRACLRKIVGDYQEFNRADGDDATPLGRTAARFAEACLMSDRIELGLAFVLLIGGDMRGISDVTLGAINAAIGAADGLALLMASDPLRN